MAFVLRIAGDVFLLAVGIVILVFLTGLDWKSATFLMLAVYAIFALVSRLTPRRNRKD